MSRVVIRRTYGCLFVFLLPWLVAAPLFADAGDPSARAARLSYLKGTVSLQVSGASDWSQASLNYPLTTGDRIYTDQGSQAELEVGTAAVRAAEATDLTVANLNDQVIQLGLGQGTIRVRVYELPPGDSIEVDTPNGALALLRPGNYRVETYPNDNTTLVVVNSGSLEVSGGGLSQTVEGRQAVKLIGTDPIEVSFVSLPGADGFDQWCAQRDRRFESSASARYVSREIPGYYDLDDYGRWQDVAEYGPVWYPVGVPAGWVPYRVGRWVWVEPWGWTWVEDEPWGFCPFHYGRWVFVGSVWGWVPGPIVVRPYYAPALVAFIGGPTFSIGIGIGGGVGWFPLGPREPFFPWYHHGDTYLRQVNVTNIRNVTNITNIINVTNVNNIHYVNQPVATTVVPATAFRSGQRVDRQVIRVNPQQIARAQVIPHPEIVPTAHALGGGRPVPPPPVPAARFATAARAGQRMPAPASRANQPYQPPVTARSAPARPNEPGPPPGSPPITRSAPPGISRAPAAPAGPPPAPSRFITRNPLPEPRVPFSAKQPVMQAHPGRPLEPQQLDNLRAGRPAGPMQDREFPPHPAPAPRTARPPANPGPPPKPAPRAPEERKRQ